MPKQTAVAPAEQGKSTAEHGRGAAATLGVVVAERLYAGLVVDHEVAGPLLTFPEGEAPEDPDEDMTLVELPTDKLVESICELIVKVAQGHEGELKGIGIALPGLIRKGTVEEAPNLPQLKGSRVGERVTQMLQARGVTAPVRVVNDADAMAAGLAAKHGRLHALIRVWTLGTGIGYGRYPFQEGVWEGGHTVVTLDEKENFCGCGGRGHLEGIMGHRAMRLRFLDMEPEEVFAAANRRPDPDPRCVEFKHLWHRALAAATASTVHISGPGKFYVTGYNVRFLDVALLKQYLHGMVKMSPLQGSSVEIVTDDKATRVVGAAVAVS